MRYEYTNRDCFAALRNHSIQDVVKATAKSTMEASTFYHFSDYSGFNIKWQPNENRHYDVYRQPRISRRTAGLVQLELPRNTTRHRSIIWRHFFLDARFVFGEYDAIIQILCKYLSRCTASTSFTAQIFIISSFLVLYSWHPSVRVCVLFQQ